MIIVNGKPVVVVVAPMGRGKTTDITAAGTAGRLWTDTDELGASAFEGEGAALQAAAWDENTAAAWDAWNAYYSRVVWNTLRDQPESYELIFIHTVHGLCLLIYQDAFLQLTRKMEGDATDEEVEAYVTMFYRTLNAVDCFWLFKDSNDAYKRVFERETALGLSEEDAKQSGDWAIANNELVTFEATMDWDAAITFVDSLFESMQAMEGPATLHDLGGDVFTELFQDDAVAQIGEEDDPPPAADPETDPSAVA